MQLVEYRLFEGKYIPLREAIPSDKMTCIRCGKSKGATFCEPQGKEPQSGKRSWFCTNPKCLEIDSAISRKIAYQNSIEKLKRNQKDAEIIRNRL